MGHVRNLDLSDLFLDIYHFYTKALLMVKWSFICNTFLNPEYVPKCSIFCNKFRNLLQKCSFFCYTFWILRLFISALFFVKNFKMHFLLLKCSLFCNKFQNVSYVIRCSSYPKLKVEVCHPNGYRYFSSDDQQLHCIKRHPGLSKAIGCQPSSFSFG